MKTVKSYLITGFVFTAVLGTLSHFFYEWTGENALVGLFSPVNESTWEHMKLIFFPVLLYSFFLPAAVNEKYPALRSALLAGGMLGTLSIPVLFYTYSGVLGKDFFAADIAVFFAGLIITFLCAWRWKDSDALEQRKSTVCILTVLLVLLFFVFTFFPPGIGLFAEPQP